MNDTFDSRPDASSDDHRDSLERRDYLRAVGGLGLVGAVGSGLPGSATARSDRTVDPHGDVDDRIETHRTGDLEVVVEDGAGDPIPDADVAVEMRDHAFGFGTAVDAPTLLEEGADAEEYCRRVTELFNTAVFGNYHKWRFWEENRETADRATEWILERGLDLRGHTCIWGDRDAYAVPTDVERAMDDDAETIRGRSLAHIEEIITHYGDDIEEWDVVNEAIHATELIESVHGEDADSVEAPILSEWYRQAQDVAPDGVSLAVNDYNTLVGPWGYARDAYERQIEYLREAGVDLGGIGMQCHVAARADGTDERLLTAEIVEGLNRYAGFGADLRITEFDTYQGDGWADDEAKADCLGRFLQAAFSHPAVADFLLWGFWDGRHWGDDAPLFYEDWSAKPGYEVYTGLVFDEWWTDERGRTGDDGIYAASAFLGEHEIAVDAPSGSTTTRVSVTDAKGTTTVTVTVDGADEPDSDALIVNDYDGDPSWPGENDLGNWNGAGSFENGSGSGEVVDGALELAYDGAGWFVERIDRDVSGRAELIVRVTGAVGGEGDHFSIALGGAQATFSSIADRRIETGVSEVRIDLEAMDVDRASPGELRFDFWAGEPGANTIAIEEIRLE